MVTDEALSRIMQCPLARAQRWNPALTMDKAAFVDYLTREIPPRPANMEAIVRANLGLGA